MSRRELQRVEFVCDGCGKTETVECEIPPHGQRLLVEAPRTWLALLGDTEKYACSAKCMLAVLAAHYAAELSTAVAKLPPARPAPTSFNGGMVMRYGAPPPPHEE